MKIIKKYLNLRSKTFFFDNDSGGKYWGILGWHLSWYMFVKDTSDAQGEKLKVRKHVTPRVPYRAPCVTLTTSSLV